MLTHQHNYYDKGGPNCAYHNYSVLKPLHNDLKNILQKYITSCCLYSRQDTFGWNRNADPYFSIWDRKASSNPCSMVMFIVSILERYLNFKTMGLFRTMGDYTWSIHHSIWPMDNHVVLVHPSSTALRSNRRIRTRHCISLGQTLGLFRTMGHYTWSIHHSIWPMDHHVVLVHPSSTALRSNRRIRTRHCISLGQTLGLLRTMDCYKISIILY